MTDGKGPGETSPGNARAEPPAARRRAKRKKVFKGARLVLGGGLSTIDCIVKDISIGGARVKVADLTRLGKTLKVVFPDGETLDAEVVHEKGVEYGLQFPSGVRPSMAPPPDLVEDVAAELESPWLESELERLSGCDAGQKPEIVEAVSDLRDAYTRLKMLLQREITHY
jgi:hypothetical protein